MLELRRMKQGINEGIEEYARRFRNLLRIATREYAWDDAIQVDSFIEGLEPITGYNVRLLNPGNLNEAIEHAKRIEGARNGLLGKIIPEQNNSMENILQENTQNIRNQILLNNIWKNQEYYDEYCDRECYDNYYTEEINEEDEYEDDLYPVNTKSEFRNAPNRRPIGIRQRTNDNMIRQQEVRTREADQRRNMNDIDINMENPRRRDEINEINEERTQATRCNVLIEGKLVKALVDTGAGPLVMSNRLRKELEIPIRRKSNVIFKIANGNKTASLGIAEIEIELDEGLIIPIRVEIIDSSEKDLILGTDLLKYGIINLKEGILTIRIDEEEYKIPISLEIKIRK
ncbi:ribonuclease H-like domain-containing protein [Rhizophagus clarus]|uniref:Ribonuclease H-like domain-containing protein n=1 Tax=Rhizophagus clarus TaxID=94130 RepID=A0A8H3LES2_9GLOM|nr:ribonuclease H-like domain-containing protein [Rhizophagus clarus]